MIFSKTNDVNQMRAELKQFFKNKVTTCDQLSKRMSDKFDEAPFGSTEKTLYAFIAAISDELFSVYNILDVLLQGTDELAQQVELKMTDIAHAVEKINKQGVDVSEVKGEIQTLKSVLASPDVAVVSEFVKDTNRRIKEYEKKREENNLAD